MSKAKRASDRYVKDACDHLICGKAIKKSFSKELKLLLASYVEEHPDATKEDLEKEFGDPRSFAAGLSEREDYARILQRARRRTVVWIVIASLLALAAAFLVWFVVYLVKHYSGTIVISPAQVIHFPVKYT